MSNEKDDDAILEKFYRQIKEKGIISRFQIDDAKVVGKTSSGKPIIEYWDESSFGQGTYGGDRQETFIVEDDDY